MAYQSWQDGEEDGDGGRVACHLCDCGDYDAGNSDGGQDGKTTERFEELSNPERETWHLHPHTKRHTETHTHTPWWCFNNVKVTYFTSFQFVW